MEKKNPIQHRMTRRSAAHDYTRPGLYHITLHVAELLGQPLGAVVGNISAPDGSADAPRTALSAVGQAVEYELIHTITRHYPMVTVDTYVIMPDHLHALIKVSKPIITKNGNAAHLGLVIAGFKQGCNRRFWEIMQWPEPAAHTAPSASAAGVAAPASAASTVPSGSAAGNKVPSSASSGRQPLFEAGYCDVMPMDEEQRATQRAYIAGNPRSRLLRSSGGQRSHVQRGALTTALTLAALRGYLKRECAPQHATDEALADIERRLLTHNGSNGSGETAAHTSAPAALGASAPASVRAGSAGAALGAVGAARYVACDAFGNTALLMERRCLPVVCHRKDAKRFAEQKARCLEAAAQGAVLVSPRIATGEQEILDAAVHRGFPVVHIIDNGFTDRYHPSVDRLDQCLADRLLLITPWHYEYRAKTDGIHVPLCKTMNCVAQALCRTKDSWWKAPVPSGFPVGS